VLARHPWMPGCVGSWVRGVILSGDAASLPGVTTPRSWVLMGLPAGVLAGAVAVAVRSADGRWRGAAFGTTAAVLIGEGIRSLLQVADTTGVATRIVEIVVGAGVLVTGVVLARSPIGRVVALGCGVLGTVGVLAGYVALS